MKLKGYVPIDGKMVKDFEYPTKMGVVKISATIASSRHNKEFARALNQHDDWIAENRDDPEFDDDAIITSTLQLLYDNVVTGWSTTILLEDDQPIQPTRENFVDLMSHEALDGTVSKFMADVKQADYFRAKQEAAAVKN